MEVVFGYIFEACFAGLLAVIAWALFPVQAERLVQMVCDRRPSAVRERRELRVIERRRLMQLRNSPVYLPRVGVVYDFEALAEEECERQEQLMWPPEAA